MSIFIAIMSTLTTLIVIMPFLIGLFNHLKKCIAKNKLKEQVCWCTVPGYHREMSLLDCIYEQSKNLIIEKEYKLTVVDKLVIKEILEKYCKDLSDSFFRNELKLDYRFTKFSNQEYFFFSLAAFLRKNQYNCYFNSNKMYDSKTIHKYDNVQRDEQYKLLEYGVIFNKLYLIAELYCENNKKINCDNSFNFSPNIKRILSDKEFTVSYFI